MSSVVIELQREAADTKIPVSSVLRKALIVATKLNVKGSAFWIEKELNGYGSDDELPAYRTVHGEIIARNEYGTWIPYVFADANTNELMSRRVIGQAVGELEHLAQISSDGGSLMMSYPASILNQLNSSNVEVGIVPVLRVGKTAVYGIVDAVRNAVLKWSLQLEADGILGEELSFTKEEKTRASHVTYTVQNFIHNFTGVLGDVKAENVSIGDYSTIHPQLKELGVSQEERNALENILDKLKVSDAPAEKENILKQGGEWLLRNGPAIGDLAIKIQSWFDAMN